MRFFRALPVFLLATVFATAVMAFGTSGDLKGKWDGAGKIRAKGFGEEETVRCKIKGRETTKRKARLSGRCASARGSGNLKLTLVKERRTDVVTATASMSGLVDEMEFSGVTTESGMVLNLVKPIHIKGRYLTARINITFFANETMHIIETLTDLKTGEISEALDIVFTK